MASYKNIVSIINELSFYSLMILPLAYIFSPALVNMIIVIIVCNFLLSSFFYKDYSLFNNNLFKILILFWLYISIQSFFLEHANIGKSTSYLRFLILPFAITFLLNYHLEKINKLKFFYITTVVLVIIDILIQYYTGKDLLGYRADQINGFFGDFEKWNTYNLQRFAGPFGFDKKAGTFILVFGIIGFFLNLENLDKIRIPYYLIFVFIISSSIIITGDRSPLLALIITFGFFFIFEKKDKRIILLLISLVAIFLLFLNFSKYTKYRYIQNIKEYSQILTNNDKPKNDLTEQYDTENVSLEMKIKKLIKDNPWSAHYLTSIEIIKSSPIFGKGIRSFRYECEKYPNINSSYADHRCSTHPHNSLFELLSEIGFLGFILFVWVIYELMKIINKRLISGNMIFYLMISLILPIKPTGAIFSTWFGSILWLLVGFYFWEKNKKKISKL